MSKLARRSHETSDSRVKNTKENTTDGASTKRADVPSKTARIFYAPHRLAQKQINEMSPGGHLDNVVQQERKLEEHSYEEKFKLFSDSRILNPHISTPYELEVWTIARQKNIEAKTNTAHPEKEDIDRIKTPWLTTQADIDKIKQPRQKLENIQNQQAERIVLPRGIHSEETRQNLKTLEKFDVQEKRIKMAEYNAAFEFHAYEKQCSTSEGKLKGLEADYKLYDQAAKSKKELPWERFKGQSLKDSETYKESLDLQITWQFAKKEYFKARSEHEKLMLQEPIKKLKKEITATKAEILRAEIMLQPHIEKQQHLTTLEKNKAAKEAELAKLDRSLPLDQTIFTNDEIRAIKDHQTNEVKKTEGITDADAEIKKLQTELAEFQKNVQRPKEQKEVEYKNEPKDLQSQLKELPGYHETDPKKKRHGSPRRLLVFRESLAERKIKSTARIRERLDDASANKLISIYEKELDRSGEDDVQRYYTHRGIEHLDKPRTDELPSRETIERYRDETKVKDIINFLAESAEKGSSYQKLKGSIRYTFSRESRRKAREVIRFYSREKGLDMSRQAYEADKNDEETHISQLKEQNKLEKGDIEKNLKTLKDALEKKSIEIKYRSGLNKGLLNSLEEKSDFKKINDRLEEQQLKADQAQMESAQAYLQQRRSELDEHELIAQIYAKNLEIKIAELNKISELHQKNDRNEVEKLDRRIKERKDERRELEEDLQYVKKEFRNAQTIIDKNIKVKDKNKPGAHEENVTRGLELADELKTFEQRNIEQQQSELQQAQERKNLEGQKEKVIDDLKQNDIALKDLQKQNPNNLKVIAASTDLLLSTQRLKQEEARLAHALAPDHTKEQFAKDQQKLYSDHIKEIDEKIDAHTARKLDAMVSNKEMAERDMALSELAIGRKALELNLDANKDKTQLHKDLQSLLHTQLDTYSAQLASSKSAEASGVRDRLQDKIKAANELQKSSIEQSIIERGGELLNIQEFTAQRRSLEKALELTDLPDGEERENYKENYQKQLTNLVTNQQERIDMDISINDRAVKVARSHHKQDATKKQQYDDALEEQHLLKIDKHLTKVLADVRDKDEHYADLEKLVKQQIKTIESKLVKQTENTSEDVTAKNASLQEQVNEWKQRLAQHHLEILKAQEEGLKNPTTPDQQLKHDRNQLAQLQAETYIKEHELANRQEQRDRDTTNDPEQVKQVNALIESQEKEIATKKDAIAKNRLTIAIQRRDELNQKIKTLDEDIALIQKTINEQWFPSEEQKKELANRQTERTELEIQHIDQQLNIFMSDHNISEEHIQDLRDTRKTLYMRWSSNQKTRIEEDLKKLEKTSDDEAQPQREYVNAINSYLGSSRPSIKLDNEYIASSTVSTFLEHQQKELELAKLKNDNTYQQKRSDDAKAALQNPFVNKEPSYLSKSEHKESTDSGEAGDVFAAIKKIKTDAKNRIKENNSRRLELEAEIKDTQAKYKRQLNSNSIVNGQSLSKKPTDEKDPAKIAEAIDDALQNATVARILQWAKINI